MDITSKSMAAQNLTLVSCSTLVLLNGFLGDGSAQAQFTNASVQPAGRNQALTQSGSNQPISTFSPNDNRPPWTKPLPEELIQPLPSPLELFRSSPTTPVPNEGVEDLQGAMTIKAFRITGSTVFNTSDFEPITKDYIGKPISLAQLFEVRSKITELYVNKGYITSGAYLPPQRISKDSVVEIRVIEGEVEAISIKGNKRLSQTYVRSRIKLFTGKPLNRTRLLEGLQLLRLNPLIGNVQAELSAGVRAGSSVLSVKIEEARTIHAQLTLDNDRSPSVGTDRRQIELSNGNVFGLGDDARVAYTNTDGSHSINFSYTVPVNPQNTTLRFSYGSSWSQVIEAPFDILDIRSRSSYYELTLRHPLILKPTEELGIGLTTSYQRSKSSLLGDIPFPAAGTDSEGQTRVTALRFFQDYTKRSERDVFALRSQFSLGLNALGATINDAPPDGEFFAWRGQAQYVRLLAPDTILLLRGDVQVADRALVAFEQFGLGGSDSVRGYRQDALLTDNGAFASAEVRIPIFRPSKDSLFQLTPFVDVGRAWNNSGRENPNLQALASVGIGLRFQWSERLSARFVWGIPIVMMNGSKSTWQDNGLYFSVIYNPF
jgi:hemolysin activation/secretion protein